MYIVINLMLIAIGPKMIPHINCCGLPIALVPRLSANTQMCVCGKPRYEAKLLILMNT